MRATLLLAILTSAVAVPALVAQAQTGPRVVIAEILADPETGRPEFVELWNSGDAAADLTGWKVQDRLATPSTYTFGAWSLEPGARVVVWSGTNATDTPEGPKWRTTTVWNNAGDAAVLIDATSAIVDYVPYGSGGGTPPTGFANATNVPAAARGKSIALDNGTWAETTPSPGRATGATGASLSFNVVNVAPTALLEVPGVLLPGEAFTATLQAGDDNGAADLASWTLRAASQLLASGTQAPPASVTVTATSTVGPWQLTLTVVDGAGATASATANTTVRAGGLAITMPEGGALRFPDLRPGDGNVVSLDAFRIRNQGLSTATPRLDVSDFRSGSGTLAVAQNLWVGATIGNSTTWHRYEGPLTALPPLAPDQEVEVRFRLAAIPVPLAAGSYGTTFAVTA